MNALPCVPARAVENGFSRPPRHGFLFWNEAILRTQIQRPDADHPTYHQPEPPMSTTSADPLPSSFTAFADGLAAPASALRERITAAWRRAEPEALPPLLDKARLPGDLADEAHELAHRIAQQLRSRKNASGRAGLVQGLLQEYSLSSQEGVALMCLAEALLRIPDAATARRADPRQDRRAATGRRISAAARRCSSTPRPGACCSPASSSRRTARRGLSARADAADRQRRRAADPQAASTWRCA